MKYQENIIISLINYFGKRKVKLKTSLNKIRETKE